MSKHRAGKRRAEKEQADDGKRLGSEVIHEHKRYALWLGKNSAVKLIVTVES